jgi:hypothetical protein
VFLTAAVRLALTSAFELSGHSWLATAAGVVGVALAALALLVAWASEVEEARGSSPLPLGRRGKGEDAMRASFAEQTRDVATEAGVRLRL